MGKKHRTTWLKINEKPDRKDVDWDDFLSLLEYLNADFKSGGGSAIGVRLNGNYAVFHKPHPGHEIYPSDLKRIRRFLQSAGIKDVE